jgi:hypothetical protein
MDYWIAQCHGFFINKRKYYNKYSLKTLPYMLAHQGYDVWIGNNRGTRFALKNCHQS